MPGYRIAEEFKARVEAASRGRITVKHYPGELLGSWDVQGAQIIKGAIDMGRLPASATFHEKMEFAVTPYMILDWEGGRNFFPPGAPGSNLMGEILGELGLHHFGCEPEGFGIVPSTKRFTPFPKTPEMAGIKTRVPFGKMMVQLGEAFGMMVVSMSFGEVPSAMMLGTIDAAIGPTFPEATAWTDVIKYVYEYRYNLWVGSWEMNGERWDSLSAEDQSIISTAMNEALLHEWDIGEQAEQDNITLLEAAGVEVIQLTTEEKSANAAVAREETWPFAEELYGKEVMDKVREAAQPLP